ncbi:hypothetical protein [Winogradskyella haliclonae]|uniref:Uncharacterized protein n=1 Tax=Winogradskyella haliclonae TaxID=2048558 RepID=A0ABQ2BW60_9FLAO|nr:hypothetical protein [Winogradskyella haliclonae]GGI55987.1 hypothetical protein GCM10011444_02960 [Winogradskyella haliclonae]
MKRSILIISTVVLSFLNLNATTLKTKATKAIVKTEITENNITTEYEWSVKTLTGKSSGTSSSLEEAKEMIRLFSRNEVVLEKKIISYHVLKSDASDSRTYYWEVDSTNGKAKGYSSSERDARAMIALVTKGEVITYKIITSKK